MTGSGPLGRDSMGFREQMQRLHGEIERLVYAAEIACNENERVRGGCPNPCPFERDGEMFNVKTKRCILFQFRDQFGDHVEQHDPTEGQ